MFLINVRHKNIAIRFFNMLLCFFLISGQALHSSAAKNAEKYSTEQANELMKEEEQRILCNRMLYAYPIIFISLIGCCYVADYMDPKKYYSPASPLSPYLNKDVCFIETNAEAFSNNIAIASSSKKKLASTIENNELQKKHYKTFKTKFKHKQMPFQKAQCRVKSYFEKRFSRARRKK